MKASKKLKVMTVLGTRPEIIRLARILPKMDQYFDHCIVYTQQSYDYELSTIFFEELELRKPDHVLSVKSATIGGQIGNILSQTEEAMLKEKPDALLILGDTNSSLAAIIAKRLKILIFHMEAGNRCFDWEVPEETNRALVDVIADYNLPYTEHARRYLIENGMHPSKTFVTGSPLGEVYVHYKEKIDKSNILSNLKLKKQQYFVVSTHREENVDFPGRLKALFNSFSTLAKTYKMPLIVTLHPRTKKRLGHVKNMHPLIKFHKPFGILDYIHLQQNAYCVVSDSGSIQEEASILRFPAVQIRQHLERPEAFDKGTMVLAGIHENTLLPAVKLVIDHKEEALNSNIPIDYYDLNVSTKVTKLMMGLVGVGKYKE